MRFGILGDAKIARQMLVPAMRNAGAEIVCLGRRNPDQPVSDPVWQGIEKTTYDDMLARQDIDAIYNPLPNHLHVPWTIKAIQAGKHVLCEKPIAMRSTEINELIELRNKSGLLIAEAYMIVHHPQWIKAKEIIQSGTLGELIQVDAVFSYNNKTDHQNIRNSSQLGGGGLPDIGVYTLGSVRFVTDQEPLTIRHADIK